MKAFKGHYAVLCAQQGSWGNFLKNFQIRFYRGKDKQFVEGFKFQDTHSPTDGGALEPIEDWRRALTGLEVQPITNSGRSELIILLAAQSNSGGEPGVAHVFDFRQGRFFEVGSLASNQFFSFYNLGNRRKAIVRSYEVGVFMSHGGQPRWPEMYQSDGARLIRSSYRAPHFYRKWISSLWETLKDYPVDMDVWACYGLACRYAQVLKVPAEEYRSMLRLVPSWKRKEEATQDRSEWVKETLRDQIKSGKWPGLKTPNLYLLPRKAIAFKVALS